MGETISVITESGEVIGREKQGVYLFAGIPYAAPPLADLRFKPPQPHPAWQKPLEAFKFGPAAPQVATGGLTNSASVRWSEDCLTLNVSTPNCDDGKRAVLFWIHGGGYRTGQGSIPWYNGTRFGQNGDIVVVSINYRLGALGFTDLSRLGDEFALSGVAGTLDQISALRWVANNIAAFGGDPNRVTIAGESAGAFSVATLLGCTEAQGLFHQAIAQSGAAHHTLPAQAASQVTDRFLEHLGSKTAADLAQVSTDKILDAQTATINDFEKGAGVTHQLGVAVSPFYPAHGNPLLHESPLQAIGKGTGSSVALLTGTNADETTLWGYGHVDEDKLNFIATQYGAPEVLQTYRQIHADKDDSELLIAFTTDHMFRIPAIRLAEARAAHTDKTWMYQFNWASRAFGGRLKATHALEIPFAFDNLDQAGVDIFIGPGETPQHVADVMHRAWCDFINTGEPGWPSYTLAGRNTQIFDEHSQLEVDPAKAAREAWAGVR